MHSAATWQGRNHCRTNTFGALAFPKRSSAVAAMAFTRGMVTCPALAGMILSVRQVPPIFAWTAIFEVVSSGDQRTDVLLDPALALRVGAGGAVRFTHGMGGTAAG